MALLVMVMSINLLVVLGMSSQEWREQPVGQVVLNFVCSLGMNMRSGVLKGTHWVLVPVLLNFELIVVFTRCAELCVSLSCVLSGVNVSHLIIIPCVISVWVNLMVLRVMFLNKSLRGVCLCSISAIHSLTVMELVLSLWCKFFSFSNDLILKLFSELLQFLFLENWLIFVLILIKFIAFEAFVSLF